MLVSFAPKHVNVGRNTRDVSVALQLMNYELSLSATYQALALLAKDGLVELGQCVVPLADTPVVEHGRLGALNELLEQRVLPLQQGKRNQPPINQRKSS
jgi:hypothetical protein